MYLFFSPPFLHVTPCSSSSWSTFSPQPFPSFSQNLLLSIVLHFSLQYHTNLTPPHPFCYLHFHELWSLLQSPLSPPGTLSTASSSLLQKSSFCSYWHPACMAYTGQHATSCLWFPASNPWFCESASSLFDSHSPEIKCYSTLPPFVLSCYLLTDLLFFCLCYTKATISGSLTHKGRHIV